MVYLKLDVQTKCASRFDHLKGLHVAIFELWPYCDNTEITHLHLSLYNLAKTICSFQFSIFTPMVYNVLEKCQTPVSEVNAPPAAFLTSI